MYKVEENTINKIWLQVLNEIKSYVDINAYNTFFLPLIPKTIQDKKLILEAPTRFVKEVILSDNFSQQINQILSKVTNTNYEIEVIEQSTLENKPKTETTIKMPSNLISSFTFDNFVVGKCNKECYEASLAVALNPGNFYNPLFIYGRAGIGKTHLLHAIGNYYNKTQAKPLNIYYTTANDFIDEFMRCNQNKDVDSMKVKFRSIDMLLLDDVQFLAGKEKTNEVFFHIFNSLFNEKKQIVLTSDRNPNDLRGLEARLVSRFASGLIVGMNAPEYETAKNILKRKIDAKNFDLNNIEDDVLTFIAQNYSSDVRQLEGALTRLIFYATTINKTQIITLPIAMEALKNITPPKKDSTPITAKDIKKAVCDYYNINLSQLIGSSRVASITTPRFIAIYLCRQMLNMTYEDIGLEFGNRDHTTIMNSCLKVEQFKNNDNAYQSVINKIQQLLTK